MCRATPRDPGSRVKHEERAAVSHVLAAWGEHGIPAQFSVWLRQFIEVLDFRSDKPGF